MAIEVSANIAAPPAIVFANLRDLDRVPLWVKELKRAYYTHQPEDQAIGTTFVQHLRQGLQINEYACEVRGFTQDEWLQVHMTGDSLIMEVDYRLVPTDTGCFLTWQTEVKPRSFFGSVIGLAFLGFSEPILRRQMVALKRLSVQDWAEAEAL